MKFAVISDLHLDSFPISNKHFDYLRDQVDLIVVPGDIHPNEMKRDQYLSELNDRVNARIFFVPGNHDYWEGTESPHCNCWKSEFMGVTFAGATLWTKMNPLEWEQYKVGINDFYHMRWSYEEYTKAHEREKEFLLNSEADVIISHHAPSYLSVHPRWRNDPLNCAFATEMYDEIYKLKKSPAYWIHGHTHNNFDYNIGETRVVCFPRGYRFESTFVNYRAKILEI